ncbi:MAG TPA: prepilin-type N-terminal cleavage/methylation domain-containing protein [Candidatus Woesebacteria bacterium]|nr:prepilin-type N-terminal cleavage/methylation domain-containing protein [Candidatus Woesebacteria bacterium]
MKKNAFTLLELLVVIGIIGILVALATVSYSATQSSGRDSRRKQDLVSIQNALEQYYSENQFSYPDNACTSSNTLLTKYLKSSWPVDPQTNTTYTASTCETTGYCVCATMEKSGSGNSGASCDWNNETKGYYCVANLQ